MEKKDQFMEEEDWYEDEDTQKDKYLTFTIGDENYGIPIINVMEIIGIQRITAVPDTAQFVKGVINLRGKVIPVIDVRLRFHMQPRGYDDRTCIIVVDMEGVSTGLIVDEVSEVIDIPAEEVELPGDSLATSEGRFISGLGKVGEDVKMILDVDKLLNDNEMKRLKNMGS